MIKVAIVGATGAVGRQMICDLEELSLDIDLKLFASSKSEGTKLKFRDQFIDVRRFNIEDIQDRQFVLMSAGSNFSKDNAYQIAAQGPIVIDNSSAWRMHSDIPLVVPEVNGELLKDFKKGIIANPNCSTIQLVVCLYPLNKYIGIKDVYVTTLQSVSGSGQKGISELQNNVHQYISGQPLIQNYYPKVIGFNIIPAIDIIDENGHCFEEIKIIKETQKILNNPKINILATTSRVPTFYCHCESVIVKLKNEVKLFDVLDLFRKAQGIIVKDRASYEDYPVNSEVHLCKDTWVCRVRLPYGAVRSNIIQFWNIADNLKKGAATNAIQIMQTLLLYHDRKYA